MYDIYLAGVQAAAKRGDQDLLQYLNSLPVDGAYKKALLFEAELSPNFVEDNTTNGMYNGMDILQVNKDVEAFLPSLANMLPRQQAQAMNAFLNKYKGTTMYDYVYGLLYGKK